MSVGSIDVALDLLMGRRTVWRVSLRARPRWPGGALFCLLVSGGNRLAWAPSASSAGARSFLLSRWSKERLAPIVRECASSTQQIKVWGN